MTQSITLTRSAKWLVAAALIGLNLITRRFDVLIVSAIAGTVTLVFLHRLLIRQRKHFIGHQALPAFLKTRLRAQHAHFTAAQLEQIEHGLRQFFLANLRSQGKFVAMPSKIADAMWHEFILHTKAYGTWCQQAFGRLLHHTPAIALGNNAQRNDGLRRAWYWACKEEGIDPRNPTRLPLLFALDAQLGIANGFHYVPDCRDIARKSDAGGSGGVTYCGTGFSEGGAAGDADGFGGAESSTANSGSEGGGGDGGGGCGGGD
jgi:hypothetical protein